MHATTDRRPRRAARRLVAPVLLLGALAACDRAETTAPADPVEGTVTLNGNGRWAYFSLAAESEVEPADPRSSGGWDVAVNGTNVMLNGGAAGPGGVVGYCICQNSATNPTNDVILAYTAASEAADFDAVSSTAIPAVGEFVADELTPAIAGWHAGTGAGATVAAGKAWSVRLRDEAAYAKLRVAAIQSPTAASPGRVTLEFATQPSTDGALGATRTLAVDVPATGAVRVDLAGGAATASATDWDVQLEGWTIRVNGGMSGAGKAAAAVLETGFAETTNAYVGASNAYRTDSYAGVFAQKPWYRYNLLGDHRISPTFDVYLVRRGSAVYKLQLTNYYGPAGETRRITMRYERIAG